jgi:MFS family permease
LLIRKQFEPRFKLEKKSYFSFWSFIKRYDNYGKFSIYQAFFNLAIMIASPFFALYMLKNLGYENNYLLYMIVSFSSTIFYLIFTPIVGKFSDRYGNLKLMWIANIIFALNPIIWIFVKTPLQIIFIPQLITGLANAASTLATANYTYDSVSQQNRGLCVAYTNTLIGVGVFIGSIIGGILLDVIPDNAFFIVFAIAGVARLLVGLFFLPQLKEVRHVSKLDISSSHLPIHFHLSNPLRNLHMGFNPFVHNKSAKSKLFSTI